MTALPFALGCPSCRHYEQVSTVDPDASLSELYAHIFSNHADFERGTADRLLTKVTDLTAAQATTR
jgi:hypothetical protein